MRVLIICEHFYPQNTIGAVRPTKIAKKLFDKGYEVDVYTKYSIGQDEKTKEKLCSNLYGIEKYCPNSTINSAKRTHGKVYNALYRGYFNLRALIYAKKYCKTFAYNLVNNSELSSKKYDVVFSTFGPLSSLFCGLYYKKKNPNIRWICDFRDPVVVKYINPIFRPYYRYLQKKACKKADAIVAVSYGYLKRICNGKFKEKSYMIPNGYDLEDAVFLKNENFSSDKLELTYVGALYGGDRDLKPLFHAIKELIDEKLIDESDIRVNYGGKEFEVIKEQAREYYLESILCDRGMLNREACFELQANSHILLLATWNDKNEYGVFPGKVLEYMLIGKPIISLTCGSLPNGEVTRVIREGNFGVAYEEACDDIDFKELKKYIRDCCESIKSSTNIGYNPNKEILEKYNYKTLIQRIEELING